MSGQFTWKPETVTWKRRDNFFLTLWRYHLIKMPYWEPRNWKFSFRGYMWLWVNHLVDYSTKRNNTSPGLYNGYIYYNIYNICIYNIYIMDIYYNIYIYNTRNYYLAYQLFIYIPDYTYLCWRGKHICGVNPSKATQVNWM